MLSPGNYRRKTPRLVSCYAFFKGWLLLSQLPGCMRVKTTLHALNVDFGTLASDLGCFPFDYEA